MAALLKNNCRVLITGGYGFIGGTLIRKLLLNSSLNIFNVDKLSYASDQFAINNLLSKMKNEQKQKYKFFHINLCNLKEVDELVNSVKPDLIFHLAAESHVDRSIQSPSDFIDSNIIGTFNLLYSARKLFDSFSDEEQNKFKLIHVSTDEVFGTLGVMGRFSEISPYSPRSPYAASKAASDHLVNAWHHTYGLPTIVTNCSNNYGPWQFPEKLIPLAINKAINDENIPLYGDGSNVRDWLFVDDHIDALLLIASKGLVGKRYCIGGSSEKTNREVLETICEILDKSITGSTSFKKLIKNVKDRPGHDYRYSIDSSLIQNELGWAPKYNFNQGIEKTVKWYLKNHIWSQEILNKAQHCNNN